MGVQALLLRFVHLLHDFGMGSDGSGAVSGRV
jgi:hypothetical protein